MKKAEETTENKKAKQKEKVKKMIHENDEKKEKVNKVKKDTSEVGTETKTETETEPEKKQDAEKEKVMEIIQKAKKSGKITYGELASELDEVNPEQIDKVFDAFETLGVNILKHDDEEPDFED